MNEHAKKLWEYLTQHNNDTFEDIGRVFGLSANIIRRLSIIQAMGMEKRFEEIVDGAYQSERA